MPPASVPDPAHEAQQARIKSYDGAWKALLAKRNAVGVADVETLQALANALLGFPGCVVVISHDRWFLDRIATHILAFEGDSRVMWFAGNYQAYEEDRKKRLGEDAAQPHRMKFRKLAQM